MLRGKERGCRFYKCFRLSALALIRARSCRAIKDGDSKVEIDQRPQSPTCYPAGVGLQRNTRGFTGVAVVTGPVVRKVQRREGTFPLKVPA